MIRTLIACSTVDGHTLKICRALQAGLEKRGHAVQVVEVNAAAALDLAACDRIVIGASVRYGKHRAEVHRFIDANRCLLDDKPSAFFSVSLVARKPGRDTPGSNPYLRAFLRQTTWVPRELAVFAGKIDYPRYRFLDRQIIRLIMWITKGPTDPGACVEYTDWSAVEAFAQRIARMGALQAGDAAADRSRHGEA